MSCKEKMLLNSNASSIAWGIGVISSLMAISCAKLTLSPWVSYPTWYHLHRNPAPSSSGADQPPWQWLMWHTELGTWWMLYLEHEQLPCLFSSQQRRLDRFLGWLRYPARFKGRCSTSVTSLSQLPGQLPYQRGEWSWLDMAWFFFFFLSP